MKNMTRGGLLLTMLLGATMVRAIVPDHTPAESRSGQQHAERSWIQAYENNLSEHLSASAQPRDWALAALLRDGIDGSPHEADRLLRRAAQSAPDDVLTQWLWATLGNRRGTRAPEADDRAARLRQLEPENLSSWSFDLVKAIGSGDEAATDRVLAHMAAATREDAHWLDAQRAWHDAILAFPPSSPPAAALMPAQASPSAEVLAMHLAFGYATAYSLPSYENLMRACRLEDHPLSSPERVEHCTKIGRLMLTRGARYFSQRIGAAVLRQVGRLEADDKEVLRESAWITQQAAKLRPRELADAAMAQTVQEWEQDHAGAEREIDANRRLLARHGVSPVPPQGWTEP